MHSWAELSVVQRTSSGEQLVSAAPPVGHAPSFHIQIKSPSHHCGMTGSRGALQHVHGSASTCKTEVLQFDANPHTAGLKFKFWDLRTSSAPPPNTEHAAEPSSEGGASSGKHLRGAYLEPDVRSQVENS